MRATLMFHQLCESMSQDDFHKEQLLKRVAALSPTGCHFLSFYVIVINPFIAKLTVPSLWNRQIKVSNLKCSPFSWARGMTSIKMHNTESRIVFIVSSNIYPVCTFKPRNFTIWGSEVVKMEEAAPISEPGYCLSLFRWSWEFIRHRFCCCCCCFVCLVQFLLLFVV